MAFGLGVLFLLLSALERAANGPGADELLYFAISQIWFAATYITERPKP
jgi:hypothetical protein